MAYVARRPEDDQYSSVSQNLQAQNRAQQGQVDKTQAQGSAPAGSANPGSSKAPGEFTKSNFSNATDILNRNKNADISSVTKRLLGNTEKNAAYENQRIADQANKYKTDTTSQVQSQYAAPGAEDIDKALKGDTASESKITSRIGMQAAPVNALDLGNRYEVAPTEFFREGEFQPLLQQRSKGGYTSGMSALDSSLFNRSGGAQAVRNTVGNLQSGVDASRDKYAGLTQEMQDYAKNYEQEQEDNLRNLITGRGQQIKSDIASRIPSAQKEAANLVSGRQSEISAQQKAAADKELQNFYSKLGLSDQYGWGLDTNSLRNQAQNYYNSYDPNKFMNITNPGYTSADLTSQEDADAYNKLSGWLGSNDVLAVGNKKPPTVAFDEKAFNDWLGNAKNTDWYKQTQKTVNDWTF